MNKLVRLTLITFCALGFCAALACQAPESGSQSSASSTPPPLPQPPSTAPQLAQPPNPEDQMKRLPAAQAIAMAKAGDALIIDVRGTDSFKIKHLKGAIDYSLERLEKGDFAGLPKDRMIVAYCA